MGYPTKCPYCDKKFNAKNVSNIINVVKTHVVNSCTKANASEKEWWKNK
jgi:hypothetical protein